MDDPVRVAERRAVGFPVPWFEIPDWRDRYGVVAGVTGRGDADDPFDLGLASAAPIGAVLDRWRALHRAFPEFQGTVLARQVHGATVLWHEARPGWTIFEGADGHATAGASLLLAVSLADCVPIFVVDPVSRAVALLHSGWRGTAAGILAAGIAELTRRGSRAGDLIVHAGVGICGACYQVGAEVATACGEPPPGADPVRLDLRRVIARQARAEGVGAVTVSSWCSAHDHGSFMSHRASGGRDGRMVALLGLIP